MKLIHQGFEVLKTRPWWPNVLLGDILFQMRHDGLYRKAQDGRRQAMFSKYDYEFRRGRPDYDLWRVNAPPFHYPPKRLVGRSAFALVFDGLESGIPAIIWGTIGSFLKVHRKRWRVFTSEQHQQLLTHFDSLITSSRLPAVIPGSEASCSMAQALLLDAIWKVKERDGQPLGIERIERYTKQFTILLRNVDPAWYPGDSISLRCLKAERLNGGLVLPMSDGVLYKRISDGLLRIGRLMPRPMYEYDPRTRLLLRRASQFALSAWRITRSQRIRDLCNAKYGRRSLRTGLEWWIDEGRMVGAAAAAALNARNPAFAGGLAHAFLRAVPDEYANDDAFWVIADRCAFIIRQSGYEIDDRYRRDIDEQRGKCLVRLKVQAETPRELWVDHDQRHSPRWKRIFDSFPVWSRVFPMLYEGYTPDADAKDYDPRFLLGAIVFGCELGSFPSPEVIRPAFNLCLRYGFLSWATRLLTSLQASARDLVNYAQAVKRALQVLPYGWDVEKQEERQTALRHAWHAWSCRQPDTNMAIWEALVLHEVLLGRRLSVVKNSTAAAARLLTEKLYGNPSAAAVRSIVRAGRHIGRRGAGAVDTVACNEMVEAIGQRSGLGHPVCVSVASVGRGKWSVLMAASRGKWRHGIECLPDLEDTARKLKQAANMWHHTDGKGGLLIPWGRAFFDLIQIIGDFIESQAGGTRWVMLAVEPELAGLPWQDLIWRKWGEKVIVSIIPSFTWAAQAYNRNQSYPPGPKLLLADEHELSNGNASSAQVGEFVELRRQIERDACWMRHHVHSVATVLGHGKWDAEKRLTLVAVKGEIVPLAARETDCWLDLAEHRLLFVHSCFGGWVGRHFLGDLGGLPGVTLGMKCRLHCAPVTQIAPAVAAVLCRNMREGTIYRTAGERYMRAVKQDRRVALYSLFGFADEAMV